MGASYRDWGLIGGNPAPGDEAEVSSLASTYRSVANELTVQRGNLKTICNGVNWCSDATNTFMNAASSLENALGAVEHRYSTVAWALWSWGSQLTGFQKRAVGLLAQAEALQPPNTPSRSATGSEWTSYQNAQNTFQDQLNSIQSQAWQLAGDYQQAAQRLANDIENVINNDGLANSWWQDLTDAVGDVAGEVQHWIRQHAALLKEIATIVGKISQIVGDIAMVVQIAGIFLPPPLDAAAELLGGVLRVAQIGLGAVTILDSVALASAGEGSWLSVGFAVASEGLNLVGGGTSNEGEQVAETAVDDSALKVGQHEAYQAAQADLGE
ncbi:MAG: hypothetical protein GJU76_15910, partial [Gallionella sp.]|nr:hypothetical protein [Gallionella sp.]